MYVKNWEQTLKLQDRCRDEVDRLVAELLEKWTYTKAKQLREAVATYESLKIALTPYP